jgi:hypothetical protein
LRAQTPILAKSIEPHANGGPPKRAYKIPIKLTSEEQMRFRTLMLDYIRKAGEKGVALNDLVNQLKARFTHPTVDFQWKIADMSRSLNREGVIRRQLPTPVERVHGKPMVLFPTGNTTVPSRGNPRGLKLGELGVEPGLREFLLTRLNKAKVPLRPMELTEMAITLGKFDKNYAGNLGNFVARVMRGLHRKGHVDRQMMGFYPAYTKRQEPPTTAETEPPTPTQEE